jgi:putative ABC transport system ATP-binding protein
MISFESVCLCHQGKDIFNNLDLTILEKENVLIQGKSGIGKTTLFKLILGFGAADSGSILFNGHKIDKTYINEIREQIFYLSQDIDLRHESVGTLLDEILKVNLIQHKNSNKIEKILNFLELDIKLLEQNIKDLSGGERQRVGLLIGSLLDRPVWLLDEPTSALDDAMKQKISKFILGLDKTIVIISHDDVWKQHKEIRIQRLG